jgi:hypothetical protein
MELTQTAKEKLGNDQVKMKICLDLGISYITFVRWIKGVKVHENFTKSRSLEVITKHTGISSDEMFQSN